MGFKSTLNNHVLSSLRIPILILVGFIYIMTLQVPSCSPNVIPVLNGSISRNRNTSENLIRNGPSSGSLTSTSSIKEKLQVKKKQQWRAKNKNLSDPDPGSGTTISSSSLSPRLTQNYVICRKNFCYPYKESEVPDLLRPPSSLVRRDLEEGSPGSGGHGEVMTNNPSSSSATTEIPVGNNTVAHEEDALHIPDIEPDTSKVEVEVQPTTEVQMVNDEPMLPMTPPPPTPPQISILHQNEEVTGDDPEIYFGLHETNKMIKCQVSGIGSEPVLIRWEKDGNKSVTLKMLGLKTRDGELRFPAFIKSFEGIYTCKVTNAKGTIDLSKSVEIKLEENAFLEPDDGMTASGTTAAIAVTIIFVTLLMVALCYEFIGKSKNGLTKSEIEAFERGDVTALHSNGYAHENANYLPYNRDFELKEDKLYVDKTDVLGSGQSGLVLRGRFDGNIVAIKTLKAGADKMYLKSLLSELKIMIYIGHHPNIVNLVGACSTKLRKGLLFIVVDCCPLGSMEKYLRQRRDQFVDILDILATKSSIGKNAQGYSTYNLVLWSYQIADAMAFLTTKKVIHGDLAARNILLYDKFTVKVTDFGLSRKLYDYTNYIKSHQEPLPWRWMAVESLREFSFSTQSDVWAYGVVLWELFSLGDIPYPGMSWTQEFTDQLAGNLRLGKPKFASNELYALMLECWHLNPGSRPTFASLKNYFYIMAQNIEMELGEPPRLKPN